MEPALSPRAGRWSQSDEVTRIREHLVGAIQLLMAGDVSGLDERQRRRRQAALDALIIYAFRGVFPKNTRFPGRVEPSFVDDFGTRCAVAWLVEQSGAPELVDRVATTANHAYVDELAPVLGDWLAENGISVSEAARIQPGYCQTASYCLPDDWSTLVEVAVVDPSSGQAEVVEAFGPSSDLIAGQMISVSLPYGRPVEVGDHFLVATVLAGFDPECLFKVSGDQAITSIDNCGLACIPNLPLTTPKDALVALAQGQDVSDLGYGWNDVECCGESQGAGWQGQSSGHTTGSGSSTSASGSTSGDGGSPGASTGGCSVSTLGPSDAVAPLLALLLAGLAAGRRRSNRRGASQV